MKCWSNGQLNVDKSSQHVYKCVVGYQGMPERMFYEREEGNRCAVPLSL
jgi:hypothetical protein